METVADIVAEIARYETSGERPGKEDFWRMGRRIAEAVDRAVAAERKTIKAALLAEAATYRLPESAPIRDALRDFAARLGGAT